VLLVHAVGKLSLYARLRYDKFTWVVRIGKLGQLDWTLSKDQKAAVSGSATYWFPAFCGTVFLWRRSRYTSRCCGSQHWLPSDGQTRTILRCS
jgi:hypothetical protein